MYKRILVPVDGSRASIAGLREAIRLAKSKRAQMRLIHVVQVLLPPGIDAGLHAEKVFESMRGAGRRVLSSAETLVRTQGLKADSVLAEMTGGLLTAAIVAEASRWRADLIVIGTHGRRGMKRLVMGSNAEEIVRIAPAPVLLVRSRPSGSLRRRKQR